MLSCVSFGFGCESFTKYEEQGIGIQWHNMHKSPEDGERFTFLLSIIMMLFDAVLYWTLTWYIENVFPGNNVFFLPTLVNVRLELEKYLCCKMQFFWSQTFVKCCYLCSNYITGEYGIPKPWYFPFTSLYWCGPTKKTSDDPDLLKDTGGQGG